MERGRHRDEWKALAGMRIEDAELLLKNRRYDAAYYLAGYAVECALKARVVRFLEGYFPPKTSLYTHDLRALLDAGGLRSELEASVKGHQSLADYWDTVADWTEGARYDIHDPKAAEDMLASAREVVKWIERYW